MTRLESETLISSKVCRMMSFILTRNVFTSDNFSIALYKQNNAQVAVAEKLQKEKLGYLLYTWFDRALKEYRCKSGIGILKLRLQSL